MYREYIEIDPTEVHGDYRLEDYFTPDAIYVLKSTEFAGIVKVEADRILTTDGDLCGSWTNYNGEKLRAEQIAHLLKTPDFALPEVFQEIKDSDRLVKYDLEWVNGGFFYPNYYFPVSYVVRDLEELTGLEIAYKPFDGAYILFPVDK